MSRSTWAEINLGALSHNLGVVRKTIAREQRIVAVVKADAYGHGLIPVSQLLSKDGVHMLGITQIEEGCELRKAGISTPILLMTGFAEEEIEALFQYKLTPVLHQRQFLPQLQRFAQKKQKVMGIHIKVDSGMGRLGFSASEVTELVEEISGLDGVKLEGIMTHFSEAEAKDQSFMFEQTQLFQKLLGPIEKLYPRLPIFHAANSAAIITYPLAHFHMVRPGIMLYGYLPAPLEREAHDLLPVMSIKSKILQLKKVPPNTSISYGRTWKARKESVIATLPIGYADGYPRLLSNQGSVLMGGKRFPIVGRICMDLLMVDVSEMRSPQVGDEVILLGEDGGGRIDADDIAKWAGTISYEVLCGVSHRIPRIYVG